MSSRRAVARARDHPLPEHHQGRRTCHRATHHRSVEWRCRRRHSGTPIPRLRRHKRQRAPADRRVSRHPPGCQRQPAAGALEVCSMYEFESRSTTFAKSESPCSVGASHSFSPTATISSDSPRRRSNEASTSTSACRHASSTPPLLSLPIHGGLVSSRITRSRNRSASMTSSKFNGRSTSGLTVSRFASASIL
jgi:hypothetical protein